jgi:hypothetical protein
MMNEKKKEMYVLMYATLEANSHCNKKREGEKKRRKTEKLWQYRSSTSQTDRQRIKSV